MFNYVADHLNSITESITNKITQQKLQPNIEFKNPEILREISSENMQNIGYEIAQARPKEK